MFSNKNKKLTHFKFALTIFCRDQQLYCSVDRNKMRVEKVNVTSYESIPTQEWFEDLFSMYSKLFGNICAWKPTRGSLC